VLLWGGNKGHRLFFYLYTFFFALTSFIGNDPVILSGTAFLAYMTRVSKNIMHPRAWIHTQFAVANIGSAILVSSNPTNLVLAGAFQIPFINYTANMIVPVVITTIVLFPFLLYVVFRNDDLVPPKIEMERLSEDAKKEAPVNPNIPHARGAAEEEERSDIGENEESKKLSLQEIMHPFLDKKGAICGAVVMAVTLITLLALNAASEKIGKHPVFWVTLPAATLLFCWDIAYGWRHRAATRLIASKGLQEIEEARAHRQAKEEEARRAALQGEGRVDEQVEAALVTPHTPDSLRKRNSDDVIIKEEGLLPPAAEQRGTSSPDGTKSLADMDEKRQVAQEVAQFPHTRRRTLVTVLAERYRWSQVTFPTATAVASHLPYALIPFAFSMFVLVEGLVKNGWIPVFAHG
jgi:Na+/H+ antiporter NhaD/arsenite permease-like protein